MTVIPERSKAPTRSDSLAICALPSPRVTRRDRFPQDYRKNRNEQREKRCGRIISSGAVPQVPRTDKENRGREIAAFTAHAIIEFWTTALTFFAVTSSCPQQSRGARPGSQAAYAKSGNVANSRSGSAGGRQPRQRRRPRHRSMHLRSALLVVRRGALPKTSLTMATPPAPP
jgi:hypothetical protein